MNCLTLVNSEFRDALHKAIVGQLIKRTQAESASPISIENYVREMYNYLKNKPNISPSLPVDAARIIPILLNQSITLDYEFKEALRKNNPDIISDIRNLSDKFEDDLENVRTFLGLNDNPAEEIKDIQAQINAAIEENKTPEQQGFIDLPAGAFSTYGDERDVTDPTSLNAQRSINQALVNQIAEKGISNSSEMEYPGVEGGIYGKIVTDEKAYYMDPKSFKDINKDYLGRYGILMLVLVDKSGNPIKFNEDGSVNKNGKIAYFKVNDTPPGLDVGSKLITTDEEFKKYKEEAKFNGSAAAKAKIFNNVKKLLDNIIDFYKKADTGTEDQIRQKAINQLTEEFKVIDQIRKKLISKQITHQNAVILGSKGFVEQNIFNPVLLSKVNFDNITPTFRLPVKADAGTLFKEGTLTFSYPGVPDQMATGAPFINRPEILENVITLFCKPIFIKSAGQVIPLSIAERNKLIEQYLFTTDVKFIGDLKNNEWVDGNGDYSVLVNSEKFRINYNNTEESVAARKALADIIRKTLTTGKVNENKSYTDKERVVGKARIVDSVESAVPGDVVKIENKYFKVQFPTINSNKTSISSNKIQNVIFNVEDGKTILQTKDMSFTEFALNNFLTPAVPDENGYLKQASPKLEFALSDYTPKKVDTKSDENPKTVEIDPYFRGKIIFKTPGSGASSFAQNNDNVIDVDKYTVDTIKENLNKYPGFEIDPDDENATTLFKFAKFTRGNTEAIYNLVKEKLKEEKDKGKTILTGSTKFFDIIDLALVQVNPEIKKLRETYQDRLKRSETSETQIIDDATDAPIILISDFIGNIITKSPEEIKKDTNTFLKIKEEAPAKPDISSLTQNTQKTKKDLEDDILNDPRFLEKKSSVKAENARSTSEQLKNAEEWYKKNPLSKHFPFQTMLSVVNTGYGPAAKWSIHGVVLYHYYKNGELNLERSGDFTDLYHEAWHGFSQTFLTPEERVDLYNEARKREGTFKDHNGNYVMFSEATANQLEEFMAEEFRAYMLAGGKAEKGSPVKNSLFRRIMNFLKELFGLASAEDVIKNPKGYDKVYDLYAKLSIGDLSNYNFDVNNRDKTINELFHTIQSLDKNDTTQFLSFQDSNLFLNSMDSIISSEINRMNNRGSKRSADGTVIPTAAFTTTLLKYEKGRQQVYKAIKETFEKTIPILQEKLAKAVTEEEKNLINQDITSLEWAIKNFGDTDNISKNRSRNDITKGLIAYHIKKSKFISAEDKEDFFDNTDLDEDLQTEIAADDSFGKAGNEKSQMDLSSEDVHYLLRSIHKYDEKGNPEYNRLGIQDLTDYHVVWNRLSRLLKGSINKLHMEQKLIEASKSDPMIAEVLSKLGPISADMPASMFRMWSNFWQVFNLSEIRLAQMTITENEEDGIRDYKVTIGSAHTQSKKTGNQWNNYFNSYNPVAGKTNYIKLEKSDVSRRRYLDVPLVLRNFGATVKGVKTFNVDKKFEFFKALGINLSDKPEIRKGIEEDIGSPTVLYLKLKSLHERGIDKLYSLKDVFKDYDPTTIDEVEHDALSSNINDFNNIAELETQYSDYAPNDMVSNAEGNTQFEKSLNNTISIIVNTINQVKTYDELMEMSHMQFLNIETNPWAANSIWLHSIFDFSKKGGPKFKQTTENSEDVKLNMTNLSGVVMINNEGVDMGISSAKSDEFTKLIYDFHLNTEGRYPELMRHADKGTSFSVWVSKITAGQDTETFTQYISNAQFINASIQGHDIIPGYTKMHKIMIPYIDAELQRINKLKSIKERSDLYTVEYDIKYLNKGQNFIAFEGILTKEIKDKLLQYSNITEAFEKDSSLQGTIEKLLNTYFEKQTADVHDMLNKAKFIDKTLINNIRYQVKSQGITDKSQKITNSEIERALVRSFAVNNWIHNFESMSFIYGDVALYNMAKEEFHKRNAGAGSTGNIFATDETSITWINNKGRLYERKLGITKEKGENILNSDGSVNSAVFQDSNPKSIYYDHYLDIFKQHFREKMGSVSESKITKAAEKALEKYKKIDEEGNAQGWCTFDFYRILRSLEGKWTDKQERMYNDIINEVPVDPKTVIDTFPVYKLQYWGHMKVKDGEMPLVAFHKFSVLPLIPGIIAKEDSNLDKLHKKMMKEGIDYALFQSGSKVSTVTKISKGESKPDRFYNNDVLHTFDNDGTYTKNITFLQYMKDQLEIAPYYKEKVTFPTQMRKLVELGLMENGVPTTFKGSKQEWENLSETQKMDNENYRKVKRYEDNISSYTAKLKTKLEKEAGIKYDSRGRIIVNDKLRKFLIKELDRQDLAEHEKEFLKTSRKKILEYDLSYSLSAEQFERILNSIVVRRLVKQKFTGEGLVQVAGTGFETTLRGALTDEEKLKYGTNGLAFYRKAKDGTTLPMDVKISLQGDFKNLLYHLHNDGEPIETIERLNQMITDEKWLDTGDNRKMITITGPRIPVQGLNSMEFAQIKEFLDPRAGNIIVLPSEIVVKAGGDYDIDKLTMMYPNISSGVDFDFWLTETGRKKLDRLVAEDDITTLDFSPENIRYIFEIDKQDRTDEDREILNYLADHSNKKVTYVTDDSEEGYQNRIISDMIDMLKDKSAFIDLITPNDVELLKNVADDLASEVMEYNPKQSLEGEKRSVIEGTRVFEIPYNLYKHVSNNVGKQVLGIAAKVNTYNALFSRIGAELNPEYTTGNGKNRVTKRLEILLDHNSVLDSDGKKVISLGGLSDVYGNIKTSEIISQLINGSVDVAKDAWLFNIQGNKETIPTLLFLIMAGVPYKQAIYFVSNPLVRAYVNEQKTIKSTFAGPLGKAPDMPNMYREKARMEMISNPKYGINSPINSFVNKKTNKKQFYISKPDLYNRTLELTNPENTSLFEGSEKSREDKLKELITEFKKTGEYTDNDRAVFLHFLEIEDMSKAITALTSNTDVDTSKSKTAFEAESKLEAMETLRDNPIFPDWVVNKLIGDPANEDSEGNVQPIKGDSPISSFNVRNFQIELFAPLFKFINNNLLNQFIISKKNGNNTKEDFASFAKSLGGEEKFINKLRYGLVSFVFQNSLNKRILDLDNLTVYKGIAVNTKYDVKQVGSIKGGVFVKEENGKRTIYIDKKKLQDSYAVLSAASEKVKVGIPINMKMFPTSDAYYSYIIEREIIRSEFPGEEGWKRMQDRKDVQDKINEYKAEYPKAEGEDEVSYNREMNKIIYEATIKSMALDNTFNLFKMFKSDESMADQLTHIQHDYPELVKQYGILNYLSANIKETNKGKDRTANIMNTDMMLDADKLNVFHENLEELSSPNRIKLDAPVVERQRVADFFNRLALFSFMQSGLNSKGQFSLVRLVSQDVFAKLMNIYGDRFLASINKNTLQTYYTKFLALNGLSETKLDEEENGEENDMPKFRSRYSDWTVKDYNPERDYKRAYHEPKDIPSMFKKDNLGNNLYNASEPSAQSLIEDIINNNPDTVFITNGLILDEKGQPRSESTVKGNLEHVLNYKRVKLNALNNIIPMPVFNSYKNSDPVKDVPITEENPLGVNPKIKEQIDNTISTIQGLITDLGYTPAFPNTGFAQYMIGADKGVLNSKLPVTAIKTFTYLSQQLFEKFNYINPNFEYALAKQNLENIVQKNQEVKDEDVDKIRDINNTFEKTIKLLWNKYSDKIKLKHPDTDIESLTNLAEKYGIQYLEDWINKCL